MDIATEVIDRIHTTAGSHSRVMCIEIMGNKAGWLTLYSGIAGGADIILLPEQPYDIDRVCEAVERRAKRGSNFSIIAVAEGAMNVDEAKLKRKEWTAKRAEAGYTTATNRIAAAVQKKDRHGDPGLHPGPHAARRQPKRLRPRAGHPVRQLRRQAGGDRAVRRYGGSREQPRHLQPSGGYRR